MKKSFPCLVVLIVFLCSCCCVSTVAFWGIASNPSLVFKQKDLGVQTDTEIARQIYRDIGFVNGIEVDLSDEIAVDNVNLETDEPLVVGEIVPTTQNKLKFSGTTKVDRIFTSEEVSSWVELVSEEWSSLPFKDPQILVHSDGTIEVSSMLSVFSAESFASELGYSDFEIQEAKDFLSIVGGDIPIYFAGQIEITDNIVTINLDSMEVIGYRPPVDVVEGFEEILTDLAERIIGMVTGLSIHELKVEDGGIRYDAIIPQKVEWSE